MNLNEINELIRSIEQKAKDLVTVAINKEIVLKEDAKRYEALVKLRNFLESKGNVVSTYNKLAIMAGLEPGSYIEDETKVDDFNVSEKEEEFDKELGMSKLAEKMVNNDHVFDADDEKIIDYLKYRFDSTDPDKTELRNNILEYAGESNDDHIEVPIIKNENAIQENNISIEDIMNEEKTMMSELNSMSEMNNSEETVDNDEEISKIDDINSEVIENEEPTVTEKETVEEKDELVQEEVLSDSTDSLDKTVEIPVEINENTESTVDNEVLPGESVLSDNSEEELKTVNDMTSTEEVGQTVSAQESKVLKVTQRNKYAFPDIITKNFTKIKAMYDCYAKDKTENENNVYLVIQNLRLNYTGKDYNTCAQEFQNIDNMISQDQNLTDNQKKSLLVKLSEIAKLINKNAKTVQENVMQSEVQTTQNVQEPVQDEQAYAAKKAA